MQDMDRHLFCIGKNLEELY